MDNDAWFEMTPENVSLYLAWRLRRKRYIIDACCGVGSNSIQFIKFSDAVFGIDSSANRIAICRHNALVYERSPRHLQFSTGDVMNFLEGMSGFASQESCLHISPPWGGGACYTKSAMILDEFPIRLSPLIRLALDKVGSVVVHLPRNTDIDDIVVQLRQMSIYYFELERIYYSSPTKRLKFYYLFIQKVSTPAKTMYSVHIDRSCPSLCDFGGSGRGRTICREAYLNMSVLGANLCEILSRYRPFSGVHYEPVTDEMYAELMKLFPGLAEAVN